MNQQQHQLMKILQKIRVFEGLEIEEAQRLIGICGFKRYKADEEIYRKGEESEEMLVLVAGKLVVENEMHEQLGNVVPGQSTGEMGVFTGHGRSATIRAEVDSAGLAIKRDSLRGLMQGDRDLAVTILDNVVNLLSDRLAEANEHVFRLMAANQAGAAEWDDGEDVDLDLDLGLDAGAGESEDDAEEEGDDASEAAVDDVEDPDDDSAVNP